MPDTTIRGRQPVSLTVKRGRGKVVVRWGEVDGEGDRVLRSKTFGDSDDLNTWISAIEFYMDKIIDRDIVFLEAKLGEHLPDMEMEIDYREPRVFIWSKTK